MTRDEVIRMAREAGLLIPSFRIDGGLSLGCCSITQFEQFAELVAKHEREACAKLAQETVCDVHTPTGIKIYGTKAAQAIRARGES